jgi:hypothetical protein
LVSIKALGRQYAGQVWQVSLDQFSDPKILLDEFVQRGWRWEVDYSNATSEEFEAFFLADVRCRAEQAEKDGRLIYVGGMYFKTASEVGRALLILDKEFFIDRDDVEGFRLGVVVSPEVG